MGWPWLAAGGPWCCSLASSSGQAGKKIRWGDFNHSHRQRKQTGLWEDFFPNSKQSKGSKPRQYKKTSFPCPSQPVLILSPHSSTSCPEQPRGNGDCGQFVRLHFSCSFLSPFNKIPPIGSSVSQNNSSKRFLHCLLLINETQGVL